MLPGSHSATFPGRDIFSPAAGHLARGDDWTTAGPVLARLARLALAEPKVDATGIAGHVIGLDGPYGNLITDIKPGPLGEIGYQLGDTVNVKIGGKAFALPFVRTFGDVAVGKPLLYVDSSNLVAVAINQGNFAQAHDVAPPTEFRIARKGQKVD
jgi:S-adenosylmethionine hydrolase